MSNEPSSHFGFTISATKSDGRTWLHLKRSDGASAALSCQTSHDSGETIASQVVTEFASALNEAADALEGGVAVTDEMVRAASMRLITALPNEAVGAIHKADYSLDDIAAAVVRSALSAPAQRVEEGLPRLENCGTYLAKDNAGQWHYLNHAKTWQGYPGPAAASPAPQRVEEDYTNSEPGKSWNAAYHLSASPAPAPHASTGDLICQDCQRPNPVWFAPNEIWNRVMGGEDAKDDPGGIVCPCCFVVRAEAAGIKPQSWELRPASAPHAGVDGEWLPIETAPKGCVTEDAGCRGTSEWFFGRVSKEFRAQGAAPFIVIRRRSWPQEDSWADNGDTHYVPRYFDAWAPISALRAALENRT